MIPAILPSSSAEMALLTIATERAREYIHHAKAPATVRAYRSDWRHFVAWCTAHNLASLPASPDSVSLYLAEFGGLLKPATLQRRMAAIAKAHQAAGHESPASMRHAAVSEVWKGIKRTHGTAQTCKAAVLTKDLRAMLRELPSNLLGVRDRALLLIGFAGAFRRSELVALQLADCEFITDGLTITIRRSKTDQEGEGRKIGIPYGSNLETCPVRSLRAYLEAASITTGPLFRPIDRHGRMSTRRLSPYGVALVVKRYATAAGFDGSNYAGHSLRAGLATSAAAAGVSERAIMNQTGHKSSAMMRRYIREGTLFTENAAAGVGL
jgi:site-specific recombinase XerD